MIKTYEDWENSLDQNYVRQLSPDAWDLTGSAFEAGQQAQQAKIDELQARVDKTDSLIMSFGNSIDIPLRNALIDAIRGLEDL